MKRGGRRMFVVDTGTGARMMLPVEWTDRGPAAQDARVSQEALGLLPTNTAAGWRERAAVLVRRVKPSQRQLKKLTVSEQKTGWRYSVTVTNIRHMRGIADSHQIQSLDALHRDHAEVEDRIHTNKAMGLHNLPSQSCPPNQSPRTRPSLSRRPRLRERKEATGLCQRRAAGVPVESFERR
jgi:hypothetical protein